MPANTTAGPRSVIHDLGYRRYDGPRLGRAQIIRALAWHSFRAAFGFGRGAKAKIVPLVALVALCLPAVVNAFAMSKGNPRVVDYDIYQPTLRDLVMTVFVAVQAPELVSRDLRSRVLPLYFARPIKTIDYPLAKYLAFTGACLVMMEVPLLLLYGGSIANVHGGAAVWGQTRALIPGLLVGLMWSVVLAAISLFLASLTGRRAFATGAVAIFFLLTFTLAEILLQVEGRDQGAQPVAVKGSGPRRLGPAAAVVYVPSLAEKVSGLFSPFTLFDGVRMWLGGTDLADGVSNPGGFGAVYALVLVIITGAVPVRPGRPLPEGAPVMTVIQIKNVSRWYGNVVAVNDITMDIGPGVTGLLGPNGAGKSTILHMIAGFLAPSRGTLTVHPALGEPVPTWRNPDIYRSLGLVPEHDSVYAFLTGEEFVRSTAKLHKLANPGAATRRRSR